MNTITIKNAGFALLAVQIDGRRIGFFASHEEACAAAQHLASTTEAATINDISEANPIEHSDWFAEAAREYRRNRGRV